MNIDAIISDIDASAARKREFVRAYKTHLETGGDPARFDPGENRLDFRDAAYLIKRVWEERQEDRPFRNPFSPRLASTSDGYRVVEALIARLVLMPLGATFTYADLKNVGGGSFRISGQTVQEAIARFIEANDHVTGGRLEKPGPVAYEIRVGPR